MLLCVYNVFLNITIMFGIIIFIGATAPVFKYKQTIGYLEGKNYNGQQTTILLLYHTG